MGMIKIAMIYDFDGTLSPGNMQEYDFIPAVGEDNDVFWENSNRLAREQDGDAILAYMYYMIHTAKNKKHSLRRDAFRNSGKDIRFFEGVKEWFGRINQYAADNGVVVEHHINSSGIKEMIEGTEIAHEFKNIFACSFFYDVDGVAYWPSVVVNYTTKTQFLFKINKGINSVFDHTLVNEYTPDEQRDVPFSRMIYFGDGTTDIPCMRLVKQLGGHSIAVYSEEKTKDKCQKLVKENRADYIVPSDYSEGSKVDLVVKNIITKIKTDYELSRLKK